jgi:hypothetical protein
MAVIRPSMPPYEEGVFLSLSLTAPQLAALKAHPLFPALVPDAAFLGESKVKPDALFNENGSSSQSQAA